MPDNVAPVVRGIQKRFRDLSVDVREERAIRYIIRQVRLGRRIDDIMNDPYIVSHTSAGVRETLLQHPSVLRAIEEEIRAQFADYGSRARTAGSSSDEQGGNSPGASQPGSNKG